MPFPESSRVIYERNPLDKVICQLRFPPILKIDAEIPAAFQDKVRGEYPNFSEIPELIPQLPQELLPQEFKDKIPPELLRVVPSSQGLKNYEFSSENRQWKVNLTRSFISLSTNKYERWEQFKEKLDSLLQALIDVYSPTHFLRIGLRYVDVIERSKLDLDNLDWSELINPHVLGIAAEKNIGKCVRSFESVYDIELSDRRSRARIRIKLEEQAEDNKNPFIIDSDFFNKEKTNTDAALDQLEFFNARATRLIRWCITERLHEAMGPNPL